MISMFLLIVDMKDTCINTRSIYLDETAGRWWREKKVKDADFDQSGGNGCLKGPRAVIS